MPLTVAFNGTALEGVPFAGGHAVYLPNFLDYVGLDTAALVAKTSNIALYIPRDDRSALFRGKQLPRSKCYVNATEDPNIYTHYSFPGFQYRAMEHYKQQMDADVAFLQPLFEVLRIKVAFDGKLHTFNQVGLAAAHPFALLITVLIRRVDVSGYHHRLLCGH